MVRRGHRKNPLTTGAGVIRKMDTGNTCVSVMFSDKKKIERPAYHSRSNSFFFCSDAEKPIRENGD